MNAIFNQVSALVSTLISNALIYGFFFAVLGLVGGIILMVKFNRNGGLDRRHDIWTFLAKINLVYVPILLALFLGSGGLVVGVQKTCNNWIDASTQPVVEYANMYLPTLKAAAMELDINSALTLEEMIALELGDHQEVAGDSYTSDLMFHYNSAIAGALLEELGYPRELDELVKVMRSLDLSRIDINFFNRIPDSIKSYAGGYFFILYKMIFLGFLPFLLIPGVEYGLHLLFAQSPELAGAGEEEFV